MRMVPFLTGGATSPGLRCLIETLIAFSLLDEVDLRVADCGW
jgi:hypothetical protein